MRQCIIGVLAAGIIGVGVASAADLPMKAPAPAFIPPPPPTWAGFYIGANLGWGFANAEATFGGATASGSLDSVVGGGQIGYNFQWGTPFVFGIEADIQGTDQSRDSTLATRFGTAFFSDQISYFGTVRARLGYAPGPWMIYVTGGLAYGQAESSVTLAGVTATRTSDTRTGWTIGVGAEWMFAPKWSAKLEYLYIDMGDVDSTATIGRFSVPFTASLTDNIIRVGVNYHF